ncbi:MAG: MerR family transcriptional regulator [Syntrophus sp. (in: bacteria)]
MKREFSTLDIVKALGIPRERLRDWMNRGFIKPVISAEGQGTKALFDLEDAYCVALFKNLLDSGFNRTVAASYATKYVTGNRGTPPDDDKIEYIIFKICTDFGKKGLHTEYLEEGLNDYKLDLATGDRAGSYEPTRDPTGTWHSIHIVNFGKIRANVKKALAKL